jgi:hypothetical protein
MDVSPCVIERLLDQGGLTKQKRMQMVSRANVC